jgi:hypothetical protein
LQIHSFNGGNQRYAIIESLQFDLDAVEDWLCWQWVLTVSCIDAKSVNVLIPCKVLHWMSWFPHSIKNLCGQNQFNMLSTPSPHPAPNGQIFSGIWLRLTFSWELKSRQYFSNGME